MTVLELMLLEFDEEMASTRRMPERVPQATLAWKPHEAEKCGRPHIRGRQ
jgi:hypothetical protein